MFAIKCELCLRSFPYKIVTPKCLQLTGKLNLEAFHTGSDAKMFEF